MEFLAGVIGALVGGLVTYFGQRVESGRVSRKLTAQSLVQTWHSSEMVRARVQGYETLVKNVESNNVQSFDRLAVSLINDDRVDEWIEASKVIHFLGLVAVMFSANEVDRHMIKKCMAVDILFWYSKLLLPISEVSIGVDDPSEISWFNEVERLAIEIKKI